MTLEQLIKKVEDYCESRMSRTRVIRWTYEIEETYIKVMKVYPNIGRRAEGFVLIADNQEWKSGTMLKPANFNFPQLKPKFADEPRTSVIVTYL